MAKSTPTPDELRLAAGFLDASARLEFTNDSHPEAIACRAVHEWLLDQADAAELRAVCREAGVPVAAARRALRERQKKGPGGS